VYTEACTVLRAVAADFFYNFWCLETVRITGFGTYQDASTVVRKTLDWQRSMVSMFEVEAVPHSCIP
jgi:hypothetical protein